MNDYTWDEFGNPYLAPLPSLAEMKTTNLASKLTEKQTRLNPQATVDEELAKSRAALDASVGQGSGLLDMAEASLYRSAGNIADTWANIQQNALGNKDYKLSAPIDNLSDTAYADAKAGFTGRNQYNQDVQGLTDSVAQGNYWDAAKQVPGLAFRTLADSAGTGVELAVGTAATAAAGALTGGAGSFIVGGALLGSKAAKAAKAVKGVVTLADRIKDGAKAVASTVGKTSLLTADITEQMRQDYKAQNNGAEPSAKDYAFNVPISIALNSLELGIFTKAMPKLPTNIKKELIDSVKVLGESQAKVAAKRIVGGAAKILESAGAEAGQEYLQTWHEILAPKIGTESFQSMLANATKEWGVDDNHVQATVGALLGFGAGGAARAPGVGVKTGVGLAKDTAVGTAKVTGEYVKNKAAKASLEVMSQEERDAFVAQHEARKAAAKVKTDDLNTKIKTLEEATTVEEMRKDPNLDTLITKYQDEQSLTDADIANSDTLSAIKDKFLRAYKAEKADININVEGERLAQFATEMGTKAVNAGKKVIEDIPIDVNQILTKAKDLSTSAIKAIENTRSSTGLGLMEMVVNEGVSDTKKAIKYSREMNIDELAKVVKVAKEKNPKLAAILDKEYKLKERALKATGLKNDSLITRDNMPQDLKDMASVGIKTSNDAISATVRLNEILNGEIGDLRTLATVKKAVNNYKNSDAVKNNVQGTLDAVNLKRWDGKLERIHNKLMNPPSKRIKDSIKDIINSRGKEYRTFLDNVKAKGPAEYFAEKDSVKYAANLFKASGAQDLVSKIRASVSNMDEETLAKVEDKVFKHYDEVVDAFTAKSKEEAAQAKTEKVKATYPKNFIKAMDNINQYKNEEALHTIITQQTSTFTKVGIKTQEDMTELLSNYPDLNTPKIQEAINKKFPKAEVKEDPTVVVEESNPTTDKPVKEQSKIVQTFNKLFERECSV